MLRGVHTCIALSLSGRLVASVLSSTEDARADVPSFQFEPCSPHVQSISGAECVACRPTRMHVRPDEEPDPACAELGEKEQRHLRCFTTGRASQEVWCDGPRRRAVDEFEFAGPLRYFLGLLIATALALVVGGAVAWLWRQDYIARSHEDD